VPVTVPVTRTSVSGPGRRLFWYGGCGTQLMMMILQALALAWYHCTRLLPTAMKKGAEGLGAAGQGLTGMLSRQGRGRWPGHSI
jgi:hypothetical protein